MKKIVLILLITCSIISGMIQAKASGYEYPVVMNLQEKFYLDISKSYQDNVTTFQVINNIHNISLTYDQLRTLLDHDPGDSAERLAIYETLNIIVTPVAGTTYEALKKKNEYYLSSTGILQTTDLTSSINPGATAEIRELNTNLLPFGFLIEFRTTTGDSFGRTGIIANDLQDMTIEEQLAEVLGIDLGTNPNGVVEAYDVLYQFVPTDNEAYRARIDFYDQLAGTTPTPSSDPDRYFVSSLTHLGTEYVVIKYTATETTAVVSKEIEKTRPMEKIVPTVLVSTSILAIGIWYYMKHMR